MLFNSLFCHENDVDYHSIPNLFSIFLLASASEGSNIERIYIIVVVTLVWPIALAMSCKSVASMTH